MKEKKQYEKEFTKDEMIRLNQQLSRIEGQCRGVKQMIENNRTCEDILIQISAINESLKSIGKKILKNHLETSVAAKIKKDQLDVIDEIFSLFRKLD